MQKQIGAFNFILLFGLLLSIPLVINYYILKLVISFLTAFNWENSFNELIIVSITCIFIGLLFGMYVQSKRDV